jgi:hypothetical protein
MVATEDLREVRDRHLLADAELATAMGNERERLISEAARLIARAIALDVAIKQLDLPATWAYRRNSRSFRALVAEWKKGR